MRSLQVVRALAVVSVVYFHIVYIGRGPVIGQFGVDIFFALSGFVMAMVVDGGQGPREFALARLARIVPLYWVLTTGLLILATVAPSLLNSTMADPAAYLKSLLFIPYLKENGLLQPLLGVGWSLNYEMLFYLLLWVGLLSWRRHAVLVASGLLVAVFVLAKMSGDPVVSRFYGHPLVFEFLLGLAAFHIYKSGVLSRVPVVVLGFVALASFVLMAVVDAHHLGMELRLVLFGAPSLAFVLSLAHMERSLNGGVARLLAVIGDGSYATYLSHVYVIEAFRRVIFPRLGVDVYAWPCVLMVMLAALVVGHLLYIAVDRPAHRFLKDKIRSRESLKQQPRPAHEVH